MPIKKIDDESKKRISRSTKLRKYASVYKSYVRKTEQSKISKSPRRPRKPEKLSRAMYKDDDKRDKRDKPERKNTKPPKPIEKSVTPPSEPKSKRKSLNSYQKFVQVESKKDKYKDLPGKERLSVIAAEWKKINK